MRRAAFTLSFVAIGAAGTALTSTGGRYDVPPLVTQGKLKVALIDHGPPPVVVRNPYVLVEAPKKFKVASKVEKVIELASIPLPRERPADEPETTGALGYAAETTAEVKLPEHVDLAPFPAATPNLSVKLAAAAKARKLTPHEKLWGQAGPVRVAALTPPDTMRNTMRDVRPFVLPTAPYDKQTAVYVISDKKVYMPDGSSLEAHSGYGEMMDNPRFAHVRMRGVTPPHVYDLKMRESLFHGVEAIRMLPMGGEEAIFGRDGILAHTYMLGPNGQSHGCISFKNYGAFLDAFKAGQINRIAVIAKLD